jgi:cell division septation protein DedD
MPNSFRDDDKILERPATGGSKGGWIAVGVVVYLLGIFTGMQVSALMGGGSCPTGPTGGSVALMAMPAPRGATPPAASAVSPVAVETSRSISPAATPVVTPAATDPDATFALQVRTFDTLEGAGKLVRRLQAAGYPAYVVTTHLPDGVESHRVRVGDYPDRASAEGAADKIAKATSLAPFVTLTLR